MDQWLLDDPWTNIYGHLGPPPKKEAKLVLLNYPSLCCCCAGQHNPWKQTRYATVIENLTGLVAQDTSNENDRAQFFASGVFQTEAAA